MPGRKSRVGAIRNALVKHEPAVRPSVAFIAWSRSGRADNFAEALGGQARTFFDLGIVRQRYIPLRYVVSSVRTIAYLARARPRSVIVSAPPVFPGAIALIYSRLTGARLVMDTHPASFGLKGDRLTRLLMPLQRVLCRRAALNLVTVPELAGLVESWGGRAAIVHEAPPGRDPRRAHPPAGRPTVLFVTIFEPDEPVAAVIEAARLLPDVDVEITGDQRRCPPELIQRAPGNVRFVGFLAATAYFEAFERANIVLSLTDRLQAVSRVGSEAVYLRRPLVISDTDSARGAFPHATYVENTPEGIASGIRSALVRYDDLIDTAEAAAGEQLDRWCSQLAYLERALSPAAPAAPTKNEGRERALHNMIGASK